MRSTVRRSRPRRRGFHRARGFDPFLVHELAPDRIEEVREVEQHLGDRGEYAVRPNDLPAPVAELANDALTL